MSRLRDILYNIGAWVWAVIIFIPVIIILFSIKEVNINELKTE